MKKVLIKFLFVTLSFFATNLVADMATGLVAHYEFENNFQDIVTSDGSQDLIDGNTSNPVTFQNGKFGQAASFDTTTNYLKSLNSAFSQSNTVTYSFWMKAPNVTAQLPFFQTVSGATTSGTINTIDTSNGTDIRTWSFDGAYTYNTDVFDDTWHHIVVTSDGQTNGVKMYLDGTEISGTLYQTVTMTLETTLYLGVRSDLTDNVSYQYNGLLDDVRIYNRTLTSSDVIELYGYVPPKLTLQAHGGALQFDNNSSYIQTTSTLNIPTEHTIEFWINTTDTDKRIVGLYDNTPWSKVAIGADGTLLSQLANDGSNSNNLYSNTVINDGLWHHVAVTYKNDGNVSIYIDQNLDKTYLTGTVAGVSLNTASLIMGYNTGNETAKMQLDEVRIWNTTRTQTQIQDNFNKQLDGNETELVAYYNFDERVEDRVYDITKNGNDGIIQGEITRHNFLGDNLYLNNSYVQTDNNVTLQSFTVSGWFKPNTTGDWTGLFSTVKDGINNQFQLVHHSYDALTLQLVSPDDSTVFVNLNASSININDGRWHHIAATYDESILTARIYVDGVAKNAIVSSGSFSSLSSPFRIGQNRNGDAAYTGGVADVTLWDKAFAIAEIPKLMYSAPKIGDPNLKGYWPLNEGADTIAHDISSSSNNGTISSTTWVHDAPTIYGNKIYTTVDTITSHQLYIEGNTSIPAYSNESPINPNINLVSTNGYFTYDANQSGDDNTTFSVLAGFSEFFDVNFKIYPAVIPIAINLTNVDFNENNVSKVSLIDDQNTSISFENTSGLGEPVQQWDGYYQENSNLFIETNSGGIIQQWYYNFCDGNIYTVASSDSCFDLNSSGTLNLDFAIHHWIDNTPKLTLKAHCGALQFDNGRDNYISLPDMTFDGNITAEAWINFKTQSTQESTRIIELGDVFRLTINPSTIQVFDGSAVSSAIVKDIWTHVAMTRDSNGDTYIYINGEQDGFSSSETAVIGTITGNFIHRSSVTTDNQNAIEMDEVRIWNTVRTGQEINDFKNKQLDGNEIGLVAYYNFDERVENTVYDISENNNTATVEGNVIRLNFLGDGLSFDGVDDYVRMSNFNLDSNFSISAWIEPNNVPYGDYEYLFNINQNGSDSLLVYLHADVLTIKTNIGGSWYAYWTDQNISSNMWQHISFNIQSGGVQEIYLDGEPVTFQSGTASASTVDTSYSYMGYSPSATAGQVDFNGTMAEVVVYNKNLLQNDVKYLMYSSLKGNETGLIGYWSLSEGSGAIAYDKKEVGGDAVANDGTITGTIWTNTAPTIYGDTIYTSQDIIATAKIITENNTTAPSYTEVTDNINVTISNNTLQYLTTIAGDDNVAVHDTANDLISDIRFVTYAYIDINTIMLNLNLSDINLTEHNITSIYAVDTNGTQILLSNTLVNGDNNISVDLEYDHNYSIRVDTNNSDAIQYYWYNFSDGKFHQQVTPSSDFKGTVNQISNLTLDMNSSNWIDFKYAPTTIIKGATYLRSADVAETNMTLNILDTYNNNGNLRDIVLTKDGETAYIASYTQGLDKVSISGSISRIDFYDTNRAYGVVLSDDETKAYLADGNNGVKIIDTATMTLLDADTNSTDAQKITISADNTKLYVADGANGLKIYDISNPSQLKYLVTYSVSNNAKDIVISKDGSKAYIANYQDGLEIVDISNSLNPTHIGSLDTTYANGVKISNDETKVYIADFSGLIIVDITDPTQPTIYPNQYSTEVNIKDVVISKDGSKAFIANAKSGNVGLEIIDINDPSNPTLIADHNITDDSYAVVLSNDETKAYVVSDAVSSMEVLDIIPNIYVNKNISLNNLIVKLNDDNNDTLLLSLDINDSSIITDGNFTDMLVVDTNYSANDINLSYTTTTSQLGSSKITVSIDDNITENNSSVYIHIYESENNITLNLSNVNLDEHNITSISYIGENENNESFQIAGTESLFNEDNNINISINNPSGDFSLLFNIDNNTTAYWYNFTDGKLYTSKGSYNDFVRNASDIISINADIINLNWIDSSSMSNLYETPTFTYYNAGSSSYGSEYIDIDSDGDLDFIAAGGGILTVREQNPIGTFTDVQVLNITEYDVYGIGVGDLNGDGRDDLLTAGSNGASTSPNMIFINQNGSDTTNSFFPTTDNLYTLNNEVFYGQQVSTGYLNNDAYLDAVWVDSSIAHIGFGIGDGTFSSFIQIDPINTNISSYDRPEIVDLDSDGDMDIALHGYGITSTSTGGITLQLNDGNGNFTELFIDQSNLSGSGITFDNTNIPALSVGDFNNDGKNDLIFYNYAQQSSVDKDLIILALRTSADGAAPAYTFSEVTTWISGNGQNIRSIIAKDINSDGYDDFVFATGAGGKLYLNNQDNTFTDAETFGSSNYVESRVVDINGDGLLDIAFNGVIYMQNNITLNLANVNLSEHDIIDFWVVGVDDNNETFNIPQIYDGNISDGNNSYTVPVYNYDHNFSMKFVLSDDTLWWVNFSDGNLYQDNNGSDFITNINSSNNNFSLDLSSANWTSNSLIQLSSVDIASFTQALTTIDDDGVIELNVTTDSIMYLAGTLSISKNIQIKNVSEHSIKFDGASSYRVFNIASGVDVTLSGLVIQNGYISGTDGAGIYNDGNLILEKSVIKHNTVNSGNGAGIYNNGTLTIRSSSLYENNTTLNGGAIANNGSLNIVNTTISSNIAGEDGGGIYAFSGDTNISHTTIAYNQSAVTPAVDVTATLSGPSGINEGATATYTVSLSQTISEDVAFTIMAIGGTAMIDTDFDAPVPNPVTITAGSISSTFNILTNNNNAIDSGKDVDVTISNPQGTYTENIVFGTATINTLIANTQSAATCNEDISNCTDYTECEPVWGAASCETQFGAPDGGGDCSTEPTMCMDHTECSMYHDSATCDTYFGGMSSGGGIYNSSGNINIINSIVIHNSDTNDHAPNIYGSVNSYGNNIFGVLDGNENITQITGTDELNITDNIIGVLDTNLFLPLHSLILDSLAVDNATCNDIQSNTVTTDQNGTLRPQGTTCDIGAVELLSSDVNNSINLTLNLSNTDQTQRYLTQVWVIGQNDNNETFNIPDITEGNIIDGNNSYTVPVYNYDHNFSIRLDINTSGVISQWWVNFADGKLYLDNNSTDFITEINTTNSNFSLDLARANWENRVPTVSIPTTINLEEDESSSISFSAFDADNDTLTISASAVQGTVVISGTELTYIPISDFYGFDTITVTVDDGYGGVVTSTVSVTVTAVNDLPNISVDASDNMFSVAEDSSYTVTFTISDPDSEDNVSLSVSSLNGTLVVLGSELTYIPNENFFGNDTITLVANDGVNTFDIYLYATVVSVNDNPTIIVDSSIEVMVNQSTTISFDTFDIDEDNLTVTATASNGDVSISNAELTYIPNTDYIGDDIISISISDGKGGTSSEVITVIITPSNTTPQILTTLNDITLNENFISYILSLNIEDTDDDDLKISLEYNSSLISIDSQFINKWLTQEEYIETNLDLNITSLLNVYGSTDIKIVIDDGELNTTSVFSLFVIPDNNTPTINYIGDLNLSEDFNFSLLMLNINDIDGDELNVSLEYNSSIIDINSSFLNQWLAFSEYNETPLELNITSRSNIYGTTPIKIIVSDGELNSIREFDLNIDPVNDSPILSPISDVLITNEQEYNITLDANDVDNDDLNFTANIIDDTLASVSITNNTLSILSIQNGITTIDVNVSDGNLSDMKSFDINISLEDIILQTMDRLDLVSGWTFVSFPTTNIICDETIQGTLSTICDQNYSLDSIFGSNENIKYMYKYTDQWVYWDKNDSINSNYQFDRFTVLSNKDGFAVRTDTSTKVYIPKNSLNNLDEFVTLNRDGWFLTGVNEAKTVSDIETLIESQGKELQYMWVYRAEAWYLYTPLDIKIEGTYPTIESIDSDEGFWIYVK